MVLTWKQRGARILGSFMLGFIGGLAVVNFRPEGFLIMLSHASVAGMITSGPQIKRMLDDYGKERR